MKALLDFIPLIAFFIVAKTMGIIPAAAALLIATVVVAMIHLAIQKGKLTKQQLVILVLTVVFCGLTLILKNDLFLRGKSTVINAIFALALIISVFINKPVMQLAMKDVFSLTRSGWNKLTLAWAMYFIIMAFLQSYFAFYASDKAWVDFKAWGWMPVMLVFMIGQFVVLRNHMNPALGSDDAKPDSNAPSPVVKDPTKEQ